MSSISDVLSTAELQQLLDILGSGHLTVEQTEAVFKSTFKEDQYLKVAHGLAFLREDAGLFGCVGSQLESVQSIIILDIMRRSAVLATDAARCVKATLFDALCFLENHLRDDARKAESTKYRSTTKDAAAAQVAGGRKGAKDIVEAETMRLHTAMKCVAFQCLSGKLDTKATSISLISQEQAVVDAALDAWQRNSSEIKEVLSDLALAAEIESEKSSVGSLQKLGALLYQPTPSSRATFLNPELARPPIPQPVTQVRDLRYILHPQSAALSQQLLFDAQWHSADWRAAKELVRLASAGPISPNQAAESVQALTPATVPRLSITGPVICSIATHNPEIAAAVLNKLKDPSALLEAILSSQAPADHLETVLLHCVQSVRQIHVYKYVASSIARIQGASSTPSDAATAGSSGEGAKELVVNLANTLHQLITKFSKDNKELYINTSQKADLGKLFDMYAHVPEVASRWSELQK